MLPRPPRWAKTSSLILVLFEETGKLAIRPADNIPLTPDGVLLDPHDLTPEALTLLTAFLERRAGEVQPRVRETTRPGEEMSMKLLLAQEAAKLLRMSENRVYDLAARGILPCIRVGRQIRFPEDKLAAWLEAGGSPLKAPASPALNVVGSEHSRTQRG
jgi:excisionase family DNA binding protein